MEVRVVVVQIERDCLSSDLLAAVDIRSILSKE